MSATKPTIEQGWTKTLPTEQGSYWHWNGDEDCSPIHMEVMTSGHPPNSTWFAPAGQWGWEEPMALEDLAGWWMKLETPNLPSDSIAMPSANERARGMIGQWLARENRNDVREALKEVLGVLEGEE